MIEAVFGECISKKPGSLLLKTAGGLAYRIWVPVSYYPKLNVGQSMSLFTAYRIREDEAHLYGFLSEKELEVFRKLLTVSGVGGKTALAVLSAYSIEEITHIFMVHDDQRISAIPGIGLGLAICRAIAEVHGGTILAGNRDGGG